jgi:hypothetical protein
MIVNGCLIFDDSYYIDALFCWKWDRLNGVASWKSIDEVASVVIRNASLERVMTFEPGDIDTLSSGFDTSCVLCNLVSMWALSGPHEYLLFDWSHGEVAIVTSRCLRSAYHWRWSSHSLFQPCFMRWIGGLYALALRSYVRSQQCRDNRR